MFNRLVLNLLQQATKALPLVRRKKINPHHESNGSLKNKALEYYFGQLYSHRNSRRNEFILFSSQLNEATKFADQQSDMANTRDRSRSPVRKVTTAEDEEITTRKQESSPDIDAMFAQESFDHLCTSFNESQRNCSNVWLSFADNSCYIYLYKGGGKPSSALAAFDLDGTIIKPKSNKRIPKSATDWDLFSVWTKVKLQQALRENDARFVIFTNQNGVGLNIVPLEEVQQRIELVMKRLDIPCTVFMATEKNEFRKPNTGMFQLFNKSFNNEIDLDLEKSFYCGDAVGYPSHSDADIKFAQKLSLPFLPPEKFLRGVKPKVVICS